jgi:hypothetical protein
MLPAYRRNVGTGAIVCVTEGDYEIPDSLVDMLLSDHPTNFAKVSGGKKAAQEPAKNRAAQPPGKDK